MTDIYEDTPYAADEDRRLVKAKTKAYYEPTRKKIIVEIDNEVIAILDQEQ